MFATQRRECPLRRSVNGGTSSSEHGQLSSVRQTPRVARAMILSGTFLTFFVNSSRYLASQSLGMVVRWRVLDHVITSSSKDSGGAPPPASCFGSTSFCLPVKTRKTFLVADFCEHSNESLAP